MADAVSGSPEGSVLGLILFAIYMNDFGDNLTIDHLLYADDVTLINPPPSEARALSAATAWVLAPNGQRTGIYPQPLQK